MYNIGNDKYIDFVYYFEDGRVLNFKTNYVSKIIDYSHVIYDKSPDNNTHIFYEKMCTEKPGVFMRTRSLCNSNECIHYDGIHFFLQKPFFSKTFTDSFSLFNNTFLLLKNRDNNNNNGNVVFIKNQLNLIGEQNAYEIYNSKTNDEKKRGYKNLINNTNTIIKENIFGFFENLQQDTYGKDEYGRMEIYLDGTNRPYKFTPTNRGQYTNE